MTNQDTQRKQMAGHNKLTAVTIYHKGRRLQAFVMLWHDEKGQAVLPVQTLDEMLNTVGCNQRGMTYSIG